ncbi:MAG: Fur family transcriptional regulator, ferric uptake regulator [Frankiaceae bacterium]|nr:Fur family transcriptional regulator, ferric uptake regulator [Frankiaceae bacterium]
MTTEDEAAVVLSVVQGALGKLRAVGGRITVARIAVLNVLEAAGGHLTADDIATEVQLAQPAVHRATVYRTLDSLVEVGVVSHTHLGHGAAVYHLVDTEHIHSQCQRCGRIIDLDAGLLAAAARVLLADHGFVLDASHSALLGTCGDCANARLPLRPPAP